MYKYYPTKWLPKSFIGIVCAWAVLQQSHISQARNFALHLTTLSRWSMQGQILVASHSLNCSFVPFPCTRMLVFKLELVHEVNEIITGPFTLFHGVNGDGELAWMALLLSALVLGKQNRLFISWSSSVAPNCWSCLGHCLGQFDNPNQRLNYIFRHMQVILFHAVVSLSVRRITNYILLTLRLCCCMRCKVSFIFEPNTWAKESAL
jgi:hypothetical protein